MQRQLSPTQKRERFRELLARPGILVMPGGFSPLYAHMAEEIGFESFFVAGSQTAAFLYGVPDVGVLSLRDMADHARHVAARTSIPVLIDSDTGYGNAVNVHYAVQEYVRAGVAGIQIEDQESPKKSGIEAGRRCIPLAEAVGKYQAAVAARDELDPSFVICARCDLIGAEGGNFPDALERCVAYATDGGADLIWLNSVGSREELAEACRQIPVPVLTIWGGPKPAPTIDEYEQLGVKVALYPTIAATAGMQAAWEVMTDLRERGAVALDEWAARVRACPAGPARQGDLVGNDAVRRLEERFLPEERQRDYDTTFGHPTLT